MRWTSMPEADQEASKDADPRGEDSEAPLAAEEDAPASPMVTSRGDNSEGVGQGSYVTPFTMTREQVAAGVSAARAMLPQLLKECSWHEASGWHRVKSSKGGARVWEKGGGSKPKRAPRPLPQPKPSTAGGQPAAHTCTASGSAHRASATAQADSGVYSHGIYSVRSSVTIDAPIDAVLATLDASVLTAHRSFTKIIYGGVVSEASVLSHDDGRRRSPLRSGTGSSDAEAATGPSEALTVRWLVCRCGSPVASDCDLCLREYTRRYSIDELAANAAVYSNNNAGERARDGLHAETEAPAAYKLFQSVETRHCPELLAARRLVRCRVPLGGFLLYPTSHSERTDVVFFLSLARPARALPARQFRAVQAVALEMARRVARLRNAADAHRMSLRLDALRASRWVDDSARPECAVCARRFHALARRRHHCRLCGEVICRDCSVLKDADLPTIGPTLLRICRECDASADGVRLQALAPSPARARDLGERHAAGAVPAWPRASAPPAAATTPSPRAKAAAKAAAPRCAARRRFSVAVMGDASAALQALSCPRPAHGQAAAKWGGVSTPPAGATAPTPSLWRPVGSGAAPAPASPSRLLLRRSVDGASGKAPTRAQPLPSAATPGSPNQREEAEAETETEVAGAAADAQPLVPRGVSEPREVQDVLVELCAQAAALCDAKFAAVSLFRAPGSAAAWSPKRPPKRPPPRQQPEDDDGGGGGREEALAAEMQHWLKARGSQKLMGVAPNLRACAPVLALRRSVATRDAAAPSAAPLRSRAVDWRELPIVAGPQQARFYAGVLLADRRGHWLGALAVFDPRPRAKETGAAGMRDKELQDQVRALEALAAAAAGSIRAREDERALQRFLRSPLLETRRSEPGARRPAGGRASPPREREPLRGKMRELVLQARETQAQARENAAAMQREGLLT